MATTAPNQPKTVAKLLADMAREMVTFEAQHGAYALRTSDFAKHDHNAIRDAVYRNKLTAFVWLIGNSGTHMVWLPDTNARALGDVARLVKGCTEAYSEYAIYVFDGSTLQRTRSLEALNNRLMMMSLDAEDAS